MRMRTLVAANTAVQILGKLITAGITFLITLLIARTYGVVGYGEFTKITAYTALFYLIGDFGFNAIVLRYIAHRPEQENYYLQNLITLRAMFALLLTGIAVIIAAVLPYRVSPPDGFTPLVKVGIFILSFTILTQALFTSVNLIFQKDLRYDRSVIASSVGSLVNLFVLAILIYYHAPLLVVLTSFICGGIAMVISSFYLGSILKRLRYETAIDFRLWKKMFTDTWPLGMTLVFNLIYFRADTFILTFFRTTSEVGIYGLAYKFFEFPLTIPTFFMNAVYPLMLKNLGPRIKNLELIKKSFSFLVLSSIFLVLCSWFLAPLLSLIKPEFQNSIVPFRILSLSLPFFFLSSLFMWTLISLGKQKLLSIIYGISMMINIMLNLIFIPQYGYIAAAIITGVSEGAVMLLTGLVTYFTVNSKYKVSSEI